LINLERAGDVALVGVEVPPPSITSPQSRIKPTFSFFLFVLALARIQQLVVQMKAI